MSTQATIIFVGPGYNKAFQVARLGQHTDGYPSHILELLGGSLGAAIAKMSKHFVEYPPHVLVGKADYPPFDAKTFPVGVDVMTGAYLWEATSGFGMKAHLESSDYVTHTKRQGWGHTTTQNKIMGENEAWGSWIYIVNSITRNIHVAIPAAHSPSVGVKTGLRYVSPMEYLEVLYDDYKATTEAEINAAVATLEELGFYVNRDLPEES